MKKGAGRRTGGFGHIAFSKNVRLENRRRATAKKTATISESSVVRVPRKFRRVLVRDLQTKPARFPEVSAQLFRAPALAFAVIVAFFNAGGMKLIDNRMKILIAHVEGKMAPAIGGFCHFAELARAIQNHALTRRHSYDGKSVPAFFQPAIQEFSVETDASIKIRRIEVQMMEPGFSYACCLGDFEKIAFRILKHQAVLP
ncbi:MAG TPA: hypothetical protein VK200_00285, partial [Candidatus Limnocylindrales bacterium]|nr:hypothetical protein [Candidatus Limnocylindrales bacterium]